MNFVDKSEYQGTTHYPVCNESVRRWREILADVSVKTAAGIAGGGEVSLFGILPSVQEKLVLVDHSYVSLWAFIGKYHTIESQGAKEALNLLRLPPQYVNQGIGYDAEGKRVKGGKYNQYGELLDRNPFSHLLDKPAERLYNCFLEANKGLVTETDRMPECGWWPLTEMAARWQEIDEGDLEGLLKRKDDVALDVLHGDISDLVEHGPVDLLYLSNALAYAGRNGKEFRLPEIVQKGALVCWTSSGGAYTSVTSTAIKTLGGLKLKPVTTAKRSRTTSPSTYNYDGSWLYNLAEVV